MWIAILLNKKKERNALLIVVLKDPLGNHSKSHVFPLQS